MDYPDGWWFQTGDDGYSTEIMAKPLTAAATRDNEARLQEVIFDRAASVHLRPSAEGNVASGGHVNISGEAFFADPILFRNFLVDFANHSELACGILLNNNIYARALVRNPLKARKFARVIRDFDAQIHPTAEVLADAIQLKVYGEKPNKTPWWCRPCAKKRAQPRRNSLRAVAKECARMDAPH